MDKSVIDIPDVVASILRSDGYDVSVKRLDATRNTEGVVIRRIPATVTDRYLDRDKVIEYIYQVIVRNRSEEEAMEQCCMIAESLDGKSITSENGSFVMIGCQEVYTEPQELALDELGFFAWETRISAQIVRS